MDTTVSRNSKVCVGEVVMRAMKSTNEHIQTKTILSKAYSKT